MRTWSDKAAVVALAAVPAIVGSSSQAATFPKIDEAQLQWASDLHRSGIERGLFIHRYETSCDLNAANFRTTGTIVADGSGRVIFVHPTDMVISRMPPTGETAAAIKFVASEVMTPDVKMKTEASVFAKHLRQIDWKPDVWTADGEIVFEWISEKKHAVVSIEGDGVIGYTMLVDGDFISGAEGDPGVDVMPIDLKEYLLEA